jgi:hypothetical protein
LMFVPVAEGSGIAKGTDTLFPDGAMLASQSMQLSHLGAYREDSGGTVWAPVSSYTGDNLYIPPSGSEGRTLRVIIKASRYEPGVSTSGSFSDSAIDDISARLFVTPRFLIVDT